MFHGVPWYWLEGICFQEEDDGSDTEGLKDILPGDLLDTDLVNTIMNEDDDITKSEDNLDDIGGRPFCYLSVMAFLQTFFNVAWNINGNYVVV
jgi:hypothetical protein